MSYPLATCWPVGFPASLFPMLGEDSGMLTHAGCGASSHGLFAEYDRGLCSWRTWSPLHGAVWGAFSEIWPRSGSMQSGRAYRRARWVRHIDGHGCSLWPTPMAMWSTKGFGVSATGRRRYGKAAIQNALETGWLPSPELTEALMGFPLGWTALEDSETP